MHLLLLFVALMAKPNVDTIDNWQIYRNKKLLASYNEFDKLRILSVKGLPMKATDILKINFFRDTPCDCPAELEITDDSGHLVKLVKTKDTFTPFLITVGDLAKYSSAAYVFTRTEKNKPDPYVVQVDSKITK